ncbi:MAG: hypothetical protein FJW94_03135 [Actinobacteria bacterium]|nr:hypothetical protein [Actinomycetota bacterium]
MMFRMDSGPGPLWCTPTRRRSVAVVVTVLLVVLALASPPGGAQTSADSPSPSIGSQSDSQSGPPVTTPGQRARTEAEIDLTRASQEQVLNEIERLRTQIADQGAVADAARSRAAAAAAASAEAQGRADVAAANAMRNRSQFQSYVTESFIRPPSQELLTLLAVSAVRDDSHVVGMVRSVAEGRQRRVEAFAAEQRDAETARDTAERARAAADSERGAAERAQADLEQGVRDQQALAAALEDRLERQLAEIEALRELDEQAAQELAEAQAAARAAATAAGVSPGQSAGAISTVAAGPPVGPGEITTVRGIPIHQSIAANLEALLAAAAADGVPLSGSGYRSSDRQVQLRRAHCGATPFDVYEKPSSQCSPPTARPGRSMHERGLAVDFRNCSVRTTACYRWLAANAARYGLLNLPSEPWHWSVNGR